jgi:hypothetical protein
MPMTTLARQDAPNTDTALVAAEPTELQGQVQALAKLVNEGQTFRVQLEAAKQDELNAFRAVQHIQSNLLTLLASPEARESGECLDRIAGLKVRLAEAESKWRTCVQAAGVLRERLDVIAQEVDAGGSPPRGAGAMVVADGSPTRGGRIASIPVSSPTLNNIKPALLRAGDIGNPRSVPPMVRPAYPPVDPRYGYNPALPTAELTEERLRAQFDALDTNGNGVLCAKEIEGLFDKLGSFGIPHHSKKFMEQSLRRSGMMDDDQITYQEFSILMLKWTSL